MDRTFGLWFIVWVIIRCCGRTHEAQFYQGCINATDSWKVFNNNKSLFEPYSCVGLCSKERYAFAAVQNGSLCFCNSAVGHWINETECNIRCASSSDLQCGGTNSRSVYSTAVPFIISASLTPFTKTIQVNTTLTFELSVLIRRPVNEVMGLDSLQSRNKSLKNIYINWEVNNNSLNFSTHSLNGNRTLSSLSISLQRPGSFKICVSAKNLVSEVKTCHVLDILLPVSGLHIVDVNPKTQMLVDGYRNISLVPTKTPFYIKAAVREGSYVTFAVSFGDNTSFAVNLTSTRYNPLSIGPTCVTIWHAYPYCGNYSINVSAVNAFSNQSLPAIPVIVQERIKSASVKDVWGLPGTLVNLAVDHQGGCELTYNWTFGDGSPSITSQVPSVSHIFNETNNYKIEVKIYDSIGSTYEVKSGTAYIRSKLSNVTISIKGPLSPHKNIYSIGTTVQFLAHIQPDSEAKNARYEWFVHVNDGGNHNKSIFKADIPSHKYQFRFAGSLLAYVVAKNKVSNVKSKPMAIIIEGPIAELKLKHVTENIIPHEKIIFQASMLNMSGTYVMLIWDFGDGTVLTTNKTRVSHVYTKEKVYDVEVMVYNHVSQQNASLTTVVTSDGSCQPPTIQILSWPKIMVKRFEEVYFESEVTLGCNSTSYPVAYQWEIYQMSEMKKLGNITSYLNEPTLIIPPYTLPYGVHAVKLRVHKEGTPGLYSKAVVQISVEKVGLVANIKGGSMRVVGYQNKHNVSLDGSSSFDPDYPEEKDQLRFKWDCHLLSDIETTCFDPRFSLSLNQSTLTFPVQWLQTGKSGFFFLLTVSKDGHMSKSTWQMIRIVDAEPHLLTVDCPQCEQGWVNPSDPLVLQGSCLTCPWTNKNLIFEWKLYLISNGAAPRADPECVYPVIESVNNQQVMTTAATERHTMKPPTTGWNPSRRNTAFPTRRITRGPTRNYKTSRPDEEVVNNQGFKVEKGNICNGPITIDSKVTPTTRCKWVSRKPSYGFGFRSEPTTTPGYWVCSPTTKPSDRFKTHSRGFGSGTVAFTQPAGSVTGPPNSRSFPTVKGFSTLKPGITNPVIPTAPSVTPSIGAYTNLYEPGYVVPAAQSHRKLLSIHRMEMILPDDWSKTGKMDRDFVLSPGKLNAEHTYMLALDVKDNFKTNQEQRRGMANVFFKVNKNPTIGGCSIGPTSGYEMDTVFGINCKHEIVQAKLSYQVTCKILGDQEDETMLLYTGSNKHSTFRLPAGKREHGYNVSVHISVFNSKRTTVKVCPVYVVVRPSKYSPSEDLLINKTKDKIQAFVKVGEEHKVKQLVYILTKTLNRFSSSSKHQQIRTEMLEMMKPFRVRDEASAIQTGETIDAITSVENEVDVEGLMIASEILPKVAKQLKQARTMNRVDEYERLVYLVTKLSSNLLSVSSYLFANDSKSTNSTQVQKLTQKTIFQVLQLVIKTKLNQLMLGEKPIRLIHQSLGVLISKSLSVLQPKVELQNVSFLLPSNMVRHLGMNSKSYASACLGTIMVVYEKSPYTWNNNQSVHKSKVSSLDLTSCHGDVKPVKNLSQEIEIDLPWVEYKDEQENNFSVKWQHLNTHTIDINNEMKNHSLQLKIETLSELTDSLRLKVLVSHDEGSLRNSLIFKSTAVGSVEFFFAPKQLMNSSGTLRVGVIIEDSAQNRIKKIIKVSPVNYSFSSKWIGCFYWDKPSGNWSTQGCRATEKTSQFTVNCRCNHLTSFGAAAFLAPNRLTQIDLRKFISEENIVAISLVVSLVLLYILLMIFGVRADKQDRRKEGVVDLTYAPCRNPHKYKIIMETGHWFGSGTTADIMIRLHGENATSDAIELVGNGKPVFQRGSTDAFLIKSPCDLSPLWKVHVWHYNQGNSPCWYLNRVIVKDMTTKEKWYFDCYRWLAVDQEDGRIDVELMTNSGLRENSLQCFYHSCVQYLMDYHLWLSVTGKPPRSRFTHAQRLTCCLSLIMSTLCVSAAWFKTDDSDTKPLQILGFLDITWNTVVLGIVCSLIVLPVNLLWILLFRYSKPRGRKRKVHPSPTDDPITDTTCLPIASVTPDEDNLSLLDQTIETLLYLKSLGNKVKWQPSYMSERSSLDSFFTNSLDDEMSYISEPPNDNLRAVASKGTSWPNKSEGASGIECNCKYQPCSMCSSGSLPPSEVKYGARKRFRLSIYFVYVGWIGCVATILCGAVFTIWYGVSFGREKSYRWLQSLCISLLESLFISQPIMVLAFLLYTLSSIHRPANKKDGVNDEDQDEGFQELPSCYTNIAFDQTHDTLKEALEMKRHQRYLKFLKPLEKSALTDTYEKKEHERTVNSYFRELFLSIGLLVLVCLLVSGLYCSCAFDIQSTVQKTILRQGNDGNNISHRTVDQWWRENHGSIVEVLYSRPMALASQNTTAAEVYFKNSQSVLVGRIRIRQFKATERQVCMTNASASQLPDGSNSSVMCWGTGAFDQGRWSSIELSRAKSEAKETVRWLTSVGWVSIRTQRISIEFVIYWPSQDVFSTVTWEVNDQLSGVPKINIQVHTLRGTLKDTTYDVFLKVCKALFVITYLLYLYYEFSTFVMMKKKYFKSFTKYLTMFCLLLSSLSVIVYVYWSVSQYNLFREMLTKVDDDVYSAGTLVYRNQELLIALYSLLIFMLVLKFVHLLTVFKFVQRFCYLLSATSFQLIGLMVFFVLFLLTFSHTGYLIFGRLNSNFKTFGSSFIYASGLLRLVGQGHFVDAFYLDRPVFSTFYLALYIAGLFVVLRGLSVSMFKVSYHSSKRRHLPTHIVVDYLLELYNRLCKAKNIEDESFESDDDDIEDTDDTDGKQIIPVEYACDEVEFQMEELLFKLDNLAGTGGLKANKLAYSSDILSGDEGDEEVEYLYRAGYPIPDQDFCGSGYESDQSFFSFGSANQEGLTDLEKERKISKDSSTLTISETSSFEQQRTFVKPDSPQMKVAAFQKPTLTPKQLYRRNSDNSTMYSTDLKVEPRCLQSSSGTSMSSRRPSLTKEFVKPKHLYPLTRKPKIRNGQILFPVTTQECDVPENSMLNVDDSTTSEENEDRKSAKAKNKSSKKHIYRRALGLLSKTTVAPMSSDMDLTEKQYHEAFRSESSLPSQSTSCNRRSSSSSDDYPRNDKRRLRSAFMFDENQRIDEPDLVHASADNIPPLSPSEPGFGIQSQDFFEAEDNLGFQMDSESYPPGLIQNISMNAEIGTNIMSIDDEGEEQRSTIRSTITEQ